MLIQRIWNALFGVKFILASDVAIDAQVAKTGADSPVVSTPIEVGSGCSGVVTLVVAAPTGVCSTEPLLETSNSLTGTWTPVLGGDFAAQAGAATVRASVAGMQRYLRVSSVIVGAGTCEYTLTGDFGVPAISDF